MPRSTPPSPPARASSSPPPRRRTSGSRCTPPCRPRDTAETLPRYCRDTSGPRCTPSCQRRAPPPHTHTRPIPAHPAFLSLRAGPSSALLPRRPRDPSDALPETLPRHVRDHPRTASTSERPCLPLAPQDALCCCCDGDEVILPPGRHSAAALGRLRECVTIRGAEGARSTVLTNGADDASFVEASAKSISLVGLTLRARGGGEGVVRVSRGWLSMSHCAVECGGPEGVRELLWTVSLHTSLRTGAADWRECACSAARTSR